MLWWTLKQLTANDWKTRESAARELGELKDSRCIEPLVAALKDGHANVRRKAEWALAQIGEPAVPKLAVALRGRNPELRNAAASALSRIGDPAAPVLGTALNENDLAVREIAAFTLAKIGTAGATGQLASALRYGKSGAKTAAASGLSMLGAKAVEPLVTALSESESPAREIVAAALVRIGKPAVPRLIASLRNNPAWESATAALSRIDPNWTKSDSAKTAVSAFIAALNSGSAQKRKDAALALGHIGDSASVEPLVATLSDPDEGVRENAALSLGEIGDPRAISRLVSALVDASESARTAISSALVRLGRSQVEPLVDALKSSNKAVRQAAASVMVQIGHSTVEPLVGVLWSIDPDLALSAEELEEGAASAPKFVAVANAEGVSGPRESTAPSLKSPQASARAPSDPQRKEPVRGLIKAASSTSLPKDSRDIQVLSHALEARNLSVRKSAISELVEIGTTADSPLVVALRDRNPTVRRAAAHALAESGDFRAREALRTDLNSPSQLTALDAAESLLKLDDLSPVRALAKMLASLDDFDCDNDPSVMLKARRALRIVQTALARQIENVVIEDLNLIAELKTRRAPRFLSVVEATVSGKAAPQDDKPPGVLSRLKETPAFTEVMELCRRELNQRGREQ